MMLSLLKKRPNATDVATRFLILKYQVVHALSTPPVDILAEMPAEDRGALGTKLKELAGTMCTALRDNGLWKHLSAEEKRYFGTAASLIPPQDLVNALWRTEAAGCLMWSLGLVAQLPSYDTQFQPEVLEPVAASGTKEFIREARLRPPAEIDKARGLAELWHWRSRTRQIEEQGYSVPADDNAPTLFQIVEMVAARANSAGDIPTPIAGDFPIFSKPYREASNDEWAVAQSIAMERHFALNWLCGYSRRNDWASTPTDT